MRDRASPAPRRGEVWLAQLDKARPVIILTRDPMGARLNAVVAVYITGTVRGLHTEVPLDRADGLRHPSVANADNTMLVSRQRLLYRIGRARPETMAALCVALARAVGCPLP